MEGFIKPLSNYAIVAAIDAMVSPLGAFVFKDESEIRKGMLIYDNGGEANKPIEASQLDDNVKNLLASIRPMLANAMGALRQNFQFYVFPRNGKNGEVIVETRGTGWFCIQMGGGQKYLFSSADCSTLTKTEVQRGRRAIPKQL